MTPNGFYRVIVVTRADGIEAWHDVIVIAPGMTEAELIAEAEIEDRLGYPGHARQTRTVPIEPDVARVVAVEYDIERGA